MENLPANYLAEIARQIAFVSAFMGGFAATFLAQLLSSNSPRRVVSWAIIASASSACLFIVSVLALTMLAVALNPDAPPSIVGSSGVLKARAIGLATFLLGMYALLAAIAVSGWMRSRRVGWASSLLAGGAAALATWTVVT